MNVNNCRLFENFVYVRDIFYLYVVQWMDAWVFLPFFAHVHFLFYFTFLQ